MTDLCNITCQKGKKVITINVKGEVYLWHSQTILTNRFDIIKEKYLFAEILLNQLCKGGANRVQEHRRKRPFHMTLKNPQEKNNA